MDYEFTLVFDVDIKHFAVSSKDRTGLFMGKPEFIINSGTGKRILEWCNSGTVPLANNKLSESEVIEAIQYCNTVAELSVLYKQYPEYAENLHQYFSDKKAILTQLTNPQNFSTNGKSNL